MIDCTEISIEKPSNYEFQANTWSSYKNDNTVKFFVAVNPFGGACFISKAYGASISDKEITKQCGFGNVVKNGDGVLMDR